MAKEQNSEQKCTKKYDNNQTAYPHSARKLLRRSSHSCRANHLQRIPQQRSTKGTNPALLIFPGTLGVFQAQGNSERSDKLVSLMSLVFYTQLTVSFFCKEKIVLLPYCQPWFTLRRQCMSHLINVPTEELV